jgi:predicted lipid-binding transport protein (Tim44 family)
MSVRASPACAAPIGQTAMRPGLFGGGLFGGIAAGFLGAGLFGLLFGHGLFGDRRPADLRLVAAAQYASACVCGGASGDWTQLWRSQWNVGRHEPLTVAKSDYDAFERLLGDIQAAYSAEDLSALPAKVTPEMLSYFSEQLAGNASRGLINRVTDVKLLQGNLAEAWREGDTACATVAMKFRSRTACERTH